MKVKVIITKDIIEVMSYEKLNTQAPVKDAWQGEGLQRDENYKQTQRNRRNTIRRLVANNFESSDLFITLTFNNLQTFDINNPKETNKEFTNFVKRLKRKYGNIIGLSVIEFQKRGAVHYHMIIKGIKYIPKKELQAIWSYGFVKVNAIDKVDNIGAYVIKYMNKDLDDNRLMGCKAYLKVGKLKEPQELKSWNKLDLIAIQQLDDLLKEKSPVYSGRYTSDSAGEITYQQYNFNRN